jgi:YidC/Oxa1 family membrane protein insertase
VDTTRFILVLSLTLVIMLLWDAWQRDYGTTSIQQGTVERDLPKKNTADIPQLSTDTVSDSTDRSEIDTISKKTIAVKTDLLNLEIDAKGGNIIAAELAKFPLSIDEPDKPVRLLAENNDLVYIIQGGIISNQQAPTHAAIYSSPKEIYTLEANQQSLKVPLYWEDASGVRVKKIFEFLKDQYLIKVTYEIENNSSHPWAGRVYGQMQRTYASMRSSGMIYTYTGGIISSQEKRYEKISFDDMQDENISRNIKNGWVAMIQHYFVTALIPGNANDEYRYYSLYLDKNKSGLDQDRYVIGGSSPPITINAGELGVLQHGLYVGPKIQKRLEQLAPGLELTVDYGVLWFIAKPLFWCLQKFHGLTGNWGWSIVLVTLMLKLLFYNLSAAGYRSMANMRRVQPKLLAIRERYKNDKTHLNKAMMELYKEEKINPLGGCFPILVQIPVFIALYWVLLESIELRQTGFVLWIKDLSTADPYFVLPIIMGVTMFIQQKLNPAPLDPVQEKVMLMLPFIFTVFFAFFPSGLVLYWVANNILSIAQQWLITRNLERAGIKT